MTINNNSNTCHKLTNEKLNRRELLKGAATLAAAASFSPLVHAAPAKTDKKIRAAVIGHTGRGNYGHGLDTVWLHTPGAEIVGVADANEKGLADAVKRLHGPRGFIDYRKMLEETQPEYVSVAPRHLDQHRDMVLAAIESGVRGIYLEKPLARTLQEADEMVAAAEKTGTKIAVAHQTRYSPIIPQMQKVISDGRIGQLLEIRARGKEDRRGGGEDLWVLGTHMFDLMHKFGGAAENCFATVRQDGHAVGKADVFDGPEGIGRLAGDEVHAQYRLSSGAIGTFDSVRNMGGNPRRFGVRIFGSKGVMELHDTSYLPTVYLLEDSSWSPSRSNKKWERISSAGVGVAEPIERSANLHAGNRVAIQDLIAAVEENREPESSIEKARVALEMIVAVFESHRMGGPVSIPLKTRENPLTLLT